MILSEGKKQMSTVLITGANRGLGLEFTKQYAADGWTVIAAARDPEKGAELKQLAAANKKIETVALDVSSDASVAEFKKKIGGRAIDVLINNAGIYPTKGNSVGTVDYKAWLDALNTNTLGPVRLTEALAENLAKSEKKLAVVISSTMGSITVYGKESAGTQAIQYRTSKTAVNMAVAVMANALKPKGITVIAQCPGWVQTEMGGAQASLTPEQSISALRKIFDRVTINETGQLFGQHGRIVAW
jgi:NAD(P)-dependent dehydrogenase (short-subunit alcohol dehydrogenase family)